MTASNLAELPVWAADLLEDARVARLGLLDADGHPRVLPVTFAVAEGGIWTAVDRKPKRDPSREPARVRFVRRDPRASLTVDRYSDDWEELAWVQVLGEVRIIDAGEPNAASAIASLSSKYEPYRNSPPPGPVLGLEPARCLWWHARDTG
ncbi:MAG: TIGR03668 family PPOX class F420-dependent oxidoreductase [Solirubrobacterales bacterium]